MKIRRAYWAWLVALPLLGSGCGRTPRDVAAAPAPGLQATLSTNVLRVGDVATLSLAWTHEADAYLLLPELDRGRDLTVLGHEQRSSTVASNRVQTVFDLRVTSFTPGEHEVYTGQVAEVTAAGVTNRYPFPRVSFQVSSVLQGDETDLRPPRPLRTWPADRWRAILGWLAAILVALAAVGAYLLYRRRRGTRPVPPPAPTPAHEIAENALAELEAKGYIEALLHEPFYVEVSAIVRHYLENRFALHAPEQTTEEFIREAATFSGLDPDHRRLTAEFLEQSDLVKFARHRPGSDDMRNAFAAAERLVRETRVREGGGS